MSVTQFGLSVEGKTADDVFTKWVSILRPYGMHDDTDESRDGAVVGECLNAVTVIEDPTRCFMKNKIRKMPVRYALGEMLWYLHAGRDIKSIQLYTHNWDRMSDDGMNVNSNYGYCIRDKYGFDQLKSVLELLKDDPSTRQAVIHIKEPQEYKGLDSRSRDINCTVCLQFFIRDEKLYMTTYMRSNDLWLGFPFDVFQFTSLQVYMAMELGVGLGTYTHIAGSLHLYMRDYLKLVENEEAIENDSRAKQLYKQVESGEATVTYASENPGKVQG